MIPDFPHGATIESIFLASYWLRQPSSITVASRQFYGTRKQRATNLNPFALHADAFSQRVLGGKISGRKLVLSHSAWPVYASVLPRELAKSNLLALTSGQNGGLAAALLAAHNEAPYVAEWRTCPECCAQDHATYGVGHWRVVHQLPGVSACPVHQVSLLHKCASCGAALGGPASLAMPGWPCMVCGSKSTTPLPVDRSPGARALASLYARLLDGHGPDLQPGRRWVLHARFIGDDPSDEAVLGYVERFRYTFGCDRVEELSSLLHASVTMHSVKSALREGNRSSATLILALTAFAEWYADAPEFEADQAFFQNEAERRHATRRESDESVEYVELCNVAAALGVPKAAIRARMDGATIREIQLRGLVSIKLWRKFLEALPEKLRFVLTQQRRQTTSSTTRGMSFDEKRQTHRARILSALRKGKNRRVDLIKECAVSCRWCRTNDAKWFSETVPSARSGPVAKA